MSVQNLQVRLQSQHNSLSGHVLDNLRLLRLAWMDRDLCEVASVLLRIVLPGGQQTFGEP